MITYASRDGGCTTFPESIAESLDGFRGWVRSPDRPDEGRWTYYRGKVLFDMAAEKVNAHAGVKSKITSVLDRWVSERSLGVVYADGVWYTDDDADLSNEPDGSFLTWGSLKTERVRLIESSEGDGDGIEYRGGPDWALEVVSNTSVVKDTQWLPEAYFAAGVREYWLVDARGDAIEFTLYRRDESITDAFTIVPPDDDGRRRSDLFGVDVKLTRRRDPIGGWQYNLEIRD